MAVTASLVASRTSGIAPLGVFFDATGTTSDATTDEFLDCYYKWRFGDPGAGSWTFGHPTLTSKNEARGPVAGHIFESGGTYNIALAVYDPDGLTDTATETITVTAESAGYSEYHYFSNNTDFTGAPAEDATHIRHPNITNFNTDVAAEILANQICYLHGGHTFTATAAVAKTITAGPWAITSFGTGKATITMTGFTGAVIVPGTTTTDGRIYNLTFDGASINTGSGSYLIGVSGAPTLSRLTILDIDCVNATGLAACSSNGNSATECFFHDCTINSVPTGAFNALRWDGAQCSVQGNEIRGNTTSGESPWRQGYSYKYVAQHNFVTDNPSSHELIAWRDTSGVGVASQYAVISENKITGVGANGNLRFGLASSEDSAKHDFLVERNWSNGSGGPGFDMTCGCTRHGVRNNFIDYSNSSASATVALNSGTPNAASVVNDQVDYDFNTIYLPSTAPAPALDPCEVCRFGASGSGSGTNFGIFGNLVYAPSASTVNEFITTIGGSAGSGTGTTTGNNSAPTGSGSPDFDDDPDFVGSNGDGTGTFTVPNDFKLLGTSPYLGIGPTDRFVWDDFFGRSRVGVTPDIGFYQYTEGTYPWESAGNSSAQRGLDMGGVRFVRMR